MALILLPGYAHFSVAPIDDAITVSRRHWIGICAGVCPQALEVVRLREDGWSEVGL